ncbi:MAG: SdiA-regulated domain-containing protein [Lutimonas sp.]
MKKYLITGIILIFLMIILGYIVFFTKEVDDVAENGPIQSQIISKIDQIPLFEGMLAASISWDFDKDRFFISTDQPHGLFTDKIASFYVANDSLDKIIYKKDLVTDGDLEGVAYIGEAEVAIISEVGTLYFLKEIGDEWEVTNKVSIFNGNGKHKLSSLAYDPVNKRLYSAEKKGRKIIYQISRDGNLLNSFEFDVGDVVTKREFSMNKDYTIAGMAFDNQHLFIFSEAYSTIFKYNPEDKQLTAVFGIKNIHESAGITLKNGIVYLVGDFEDYLPAPNFYKVKLPE